MFFFHFFYASVCRTSPSVYGVSLPWYDWYAHKLWIRERNHTIWIWLRFSPKQQVLSYIWIPLYAVVCWIVTSILNGLIVQCRPVVQAQDAVTVVLSGRIDKAMAGLREKLETAYKTSGGKKVNLISHSMGGLLVRCFMSMNHDVSFHVCYAFCLCINIHVIIFPIL